MKNVFWGELAHLLSAFQTQLDGLSHPMFKSSQDWTKSHSKTFSTSVSRNREGEAVYSYAVDGKERLNVRTNAKSLPQDGSLGSFWVEGMTSPEPLTLKALFECPEKAEPIKELWACMLKDFTLDSANKRAIHNAWSNRAKKEPQSLQREEREAAVEQITEMSERLVTAEEKPTTPVDREYKIERNADRDLQFKGRLLASVPSGWHMGRRHVYAVFRTVGGKHVFLKRGESVMPGEVSRNEVKVSQEMAECVDFFGFDALAKALYGRLELDTVEKLD